MIYWSIYFDACFFFTYREFGQIFHLQFYFYLVTYMVLLDLFIFVHWGLEDIIVIVINHEQRFILLFFFFV